MPEKGNAKSSGNIWIFLSNIFSWKRLIYETEIQNSDILKEYEYVNHYVLFDLSMGADKIKFGVLYMIRFLEYRRNYHCPIKMQQILKTMCIFSLSQN